MGRFAKNLLLWSFVALCLVCIPLQSTTYDASACGACAWPNSDPDARGFYDTIRLFSNWQGNFYKKYGFCLESYYKSSTYSGTEDSWIDTSHIHYHVGHGGSHTDSGNSTDLTAIVFAATADDAKYLDASEAASAWGTNTLDWIAFRCCKLLDDTSWSYWGETMNGLHLILGFKTVSSKADNFGKIWANKMHRVVFDVGPIHFVIPAQTIAQAWYSAVDFTQSEDVIARVIGETTQCYSDYLHGNGTVCSDPTADNTKNHWEHEANPIFDQLIAQGIVIVNVAKQVVVPQIVDAVHVRGIGAAFGFDAEDEVYELEDAYVMSRPDDEDPDPDNPVHLLYVYKNSGMYYYQDLSRLWKIDHDNPTIPGIYPEANAPQRADEFLTANGLYPADVHDYGVGADEIVEENIETHARTEYPVYRCVVYSRAVEASADEPVSVVGPGARLKVYIDEDGSIMGAMGNWREVQTAGTTPIMTREAAWDLFVQMGQEAAVAPIYLEYDNVQTDLNTAAFGYYEHDGTELQAELIPVWIFNTDYYKDGELVLTAHTHIPAAI
jgi:hypothetical protein